MREIAVISNWMNLNSRRGLNFESIASVGVLSYPFLYIVLTLKDAARLMMMTHGIVA